MATIGAASTTLFAHGGPTVSLTPGQMREGLRTALDRLGSRDNVIAVVPDATRFYSRAGEIASGALDYYGARLTDILVAGGTHRAMTPEEMDRMYPGVPHGLFRSHNWRTDVETLGEVPASFISDISNKHLSYAWPAQVNRMLVKGGHDLILSIGQVVPHEVAGMANHSKNLFVGTGGREGIDRSHFLGAVCGMESMMGRADTPVRRVFNYALGHFAAAMPVVYALTVVSSDGLHVRGLFVGSGIDCFTQAAALSAQINVFPLDKPCAKIVVYLDPHEYQSTWLGNKAIYRTRMAVATGGEVIVLAPGVERFGEDATIDRLIRRHGYRGTDAALAAVKSDPELAENLSAAAHLIHGSSEGRFKVTYCPGSLTREETEGAGFAWADLTGMLRRYDPSKLCAGINRLSDGEEIFFVPNPGLGLWRAVTSA